MIVTRPLHPGEPDLLTGNEREPVRFVSDDAARREIARVPAPALGWTHDALEAVSPPQASYWDAYLGIRWVGSSEV